MGKMHQQYDVVVQLLTVMHTLALGSQHAGRARNVVSRIIFCTEGCQRWQCWCPVYATESDVVCLCASGMFSLVQCFAFCGMVSSTTSVTVQTVHRRTVEMHAS